MKVKNQSCIRHLSYKTLWASRKRNMIAVCAIALTALLFTSLFTIVLSINQTNQNYQFRSVGTYAHGSFKNVDQTQIETIAAHPRIRAVGERTVIGLCITGAFEKDYGEVSFMDDHAAKWGYALPSVGRIPASGREIAMDTKALELLGVAPQLGAQIQLTYTLADKNQMGGEITDTFTLVGYWEYDELMGVHFLNVSREYVQEIEKKAISEGMNPFRTDLSVMLPSSLNIEEQLCRIGEDCGYSVGDGIDQQRIGVNWGYTTTQLADTMGFGGILAIIAVMLLVAFTGYLVIYNIFQISVAGDIRYYGLLKTIGVTPGQLRRIIRQQALLLSALGIPLGLLLGYGVGALAVPIALSSSLYSGKYTQISTSPWIFIGAAAFALITVLLSCAKPGRIAGRVSPVEAAKYTQARQVSRARRATRQVTPFSMASANLGRGRGKTALVVVSLSLSVVLLNVLFTFISGFDMDKYLSNMTCADFIVGTQGYFNYFGSTLEKDDILPIQENTRQSLGGFTYETGLVKMYMPEETWKREASYYIGEKEMEELLESAHRDGNRIAADSQLEGLDAALLEKLVLVYGDLSPLRQADSKAIAMVVSLDANGRIAHPEDYPAIGEEVKVTYGLGDAEYDVLYRVCAYVDVPYSMSCRSYPLGYQAVLPVETLIRDVGEENVIPMCYVFDTPDPQAEADAESYLAAATASPTSSLMYESKTTKREHFREYQMTFALLGGLLCAIIGIVGVLNFINAMMTSILSRQREFAVLQSIGMTGRQLKAMLIWEGLLYTLGSGLISLLLSAAVNPLAGALLEKAYWFFSYSYTLTPVLLAVPVFMLLGFAIPSLMYGQAAKHSIVERLRTTD